MKEFETSGLSMNEMNGKTVITAPDGAVYLSEFMDSLPIGILNKKETGCGATTLVLENQENVIIACPTRQLIHNKVFQYPNTRCSYRIFPVLKGVFQNHVEEYIDECSSRQPIKIMVTYDSFPKVYEVIKKKGIQCKVIIDEYQELLDAYIYRRDAIYNLLNELKNLDNVTYLSATPISCQWRPKELENLREYEINWKNSVRIMPYRIESKSPLTIVVNIIRNHKMGKPFELRGHKVKEYFFFVNSITAIREILKKTNLYPNEVKIICGNNEINKKRLDEFPIENADGINKTFTFCTKTAFYGADFYSDAGLAIIVSDGYAKSTLLDIATDIQQIAGRIRTINNPFKDIILHIYNTGIMCENKTEYEEKLAIRLNKANETIAAYNCLPDDLKKVITERIRTNDPEEFAVYNVKEQRVEIDMMKYNYAQYKFMTIDNIYTKGISIRDSYIKAGFNVKDAEVLTQNINDNIFWGIDIGRFKRSYLMYSNDRKQYPLGKSDLAKDIELQNDIIPLAYNYLGDDMVMQLGYDENKVRKMVHYKLPETQNALKEELNVTFKKGNRYSLREIKRLLKLCFEKLRIDIVAKATLLKDFFIVKRVKINDSFKRIEGYEIIAVNTL